MPCGGRRPYAPAAFGAGLSAGGAGGLPPVPEPGGPSAYEVRGALVALRPKDAATVVVQADAVTEGI